MAMLLQEFFNRYTLLVYFVYGLVFFLLGFAIALQSRRHTHLELARSLKWLAAFGIIHGIQEWLVIIVPLQAINVGDAASSFLLTLKLVTLIASYFCLFQFGVELLKDRWPWLTYLSYLILGFLIVSLLVQRFLSGYEPVSWHRTGTIWAKYLLGFPGALLAAYGLYYQAKRQIKPLKLPHIDRMFQIAALAFAAYAILTGLIVPPGDFFPANTINSANFVALVGIPAPVFRSLAGLVIAVAVIRGLEVFDVEVDRNFDQMEVERSLMAQRERIGQELHDGAIQQVYTAGLIVESVRNKVEEPLLDQRLENAMSAMNEAITGLRTYMEGLRESDSQVSLAEGLRKQTTDPRLTVLLQVDLDLEIKNEDNMSPDRVNRVLAIVSEALANAARHAQAHHVIVKAQRKKDRLFLAVEDDGHGFKPKADNNGYGLRDMYDHARFLGGELTVDSKPGKGTRISLLAPWGDG